MTFGEALKILRGELPRTAVAPAEYSEQQRRDFANYLGRIERDEVPSLGLTRLTEIAQGLGYDTMSGFWTAIEGVQGTGRVMVPDESERAIVLKWLDSQMAASKRAVRHLRRVRDIMVASGSKSDAAAEAAMRRYGIH